MVWSNFNRVSKLERSVREIKQDIKDITHVVSQHELEIDSIEDKIGDE
jgi:t-SNARE complex subunit (syntaxin)